MYMYVYEVCMYVCTYAMNGIYDMVYIVLCMYEYLCIVCSNALGCAYLHTSRTL